MNNSEYLDSYLKYYYNIGLTKPQYESRALYNQVNFSDSCSFNNVYIFSVPKTIQNSLSYVTPSQKKLIIDTIRDEQVLTSETIVSDPVYIAFDLCVQSENIITKTDINNSEIYVIKTSNNRRSDSSIKNDIQNAIVDFFSVTKNSLGSSINMQQLNTNLLDIDGVSQIYTRNKVSNSLLEGIQMVNWNPVYFDITVSQIPTTLKLENFQFPFLNNKSFVDRITIG
jgi:ribosome-interacting GTPase 1